MSQPNPAMVRSPGQPGTPARGKKQAAADTAEANTVPAKQPRLSGSGGDASAGDLAARAGGGMEADLPPVVLPDADSVAMHLAIAEHCRV